jgi:hypothetical protein
MDVDIDIDRDMDMETDLETDTPIDMDTAMDMEMDIPVIQRTLLGRFGRQISDIFKAFNYISNIRSDSPPSVRYRRFPYHTLSDIVHTDIGLGAHLRIYVPHAAV